MQSYFKYVKGINEVYAEDDSTNELSYRLLLHDLLKKITTNLNANIKIIHEGKSIKKAGKPDFFLKDKKTLLNLSFIETKGIFSKEIEEQHHQIGRYVQNLDIVCTTDYCNFNLFIKGKKVKEVALLLKKKNQFFLDEQKVQSFEELISKLLQHSYQKEVSSHGLALYLASKAKLIKSTLEDLIDSRKPESQKIIIAFNYYQKSLKPDSTINEFVSNYVQCLIYGLFVAKIENSTVEIKKENITNLLSSKQGILKTLFGFLNEEECLGEQVNWILDDVAAYLNIIDIDAIKKEFDYNNWKEDPVIHFYETFIKYYDPNEKTEKGIFYTPDPVVSYIVESVDLILRNPATFNKKTGLASSGVTLLDPAAGTSTFLVKSLKKAYSNMMDESYQGKAKKDLTESVLPNFFGMEISLAPYVISHLKLSKMLEDFTIENSQDKHLNLFLTNTLSMKEGESGELEFMKELAKENHRANRVKKEQPILVIIGNPPYSASISNSKSKFMDNLIKDYRKLNTKIEKNSKALSNDYVKFIRWGEWKLAQSSNYGILGFITSNSYLDGVTHTGMRKHLMANFDEIYILNLHGDNRLPKLNGEEKDENVFDIKEGVSIIFGLKTSSNTAKAAKVYYHEIIGSRSRKYLHLLNKNIVTDEYEEMKPSAPYFLFKPQSNILSIVEGMSLDSIFISKYQGVKTHRDHFVVSHDKENLLNRLHIASSKRKTVDEICEELELESSETWCSNEAIIRLKKDGYSEEIVHSYGYRPFFNSFIYNDSNLIDRPRKEMQDDVQVKNNRFLIVGRSGKNISGSWNLVFSAETLVDTNFFYRGGAYCFPVYSSNADKPLLDTYESNINIEFIKDVRKKYGLNQINDMDVYFYILGLLNDENYIEENKEQLNIDFPIIPIKSKNKFLLYREYGELIDELFLKGIDPKEVGLSLKICGKNLKVEEFKYMDSKLYFNEKSYIEGLSSDHLNFTQGGYPIIEKFFKDLKKQELSLDKKFLNGLERAVASKELLMEIKDDLKADILILEESAQTSNLIQEKLLKRLNKLENKIKLKIS
ncbi:type ISP restriction/modification enzyme [Bacteriovorax sp. PP10]|uniref:site-specific DNA-methyltransferase (adenine-specific) n=1 Tax=Bacteriovorax antarcticus TaxID=3088717 RepID=A0ABU5VXW8_9BACT|nr:type ISP restriction/modification enzyme [Bacteriovorax sp. PP10]MEA9357203.1 type ISP restriction/modification enzyme [Bacteriovorax sp. PP10]